MREVDPSLPGNATASDWKLFGLNDFRLPKEAEDADMAFVFVASRRPESLGWPVPEHDADLLSGVGAWGTSATKGDETFETLLMMQMVNEEER